MWRTLIATMLVLEFGIGCVGFTPGGGRIGVVYTDVVGTSPMLHAPVGQTSKWSKTGEATCTSVLMIVATGDCSVEAASRQGNIARIHHVDYHVKSILGITVTETTIVYGD
jgi:hypothetical protein